MAVPRLAGGKLSSKIAWASGCKAPPPAPCKTRAITRKPRLVAIPHMKEDTVKMPMQQIRNRLRPKKLANHALVGSTMALDTR